MIVARRANVGTENLYFEFRDRVRAHHDAQLLPGPYAIGGTVTLDPRTTPVIENLIDLPRKLSGIGQLPIACAGLGVFKLDQVSSV